MRFVWERCCEWFGQPLRWSYVALTWFIFVIFAGVLFAFRCLKTSSFADALHIENFAVLKAVDSHYHHLYLAMGACGFVALLGTALLLFKRLRERYPLALLLMLVVAVILSLITARYTFVTADAAANSEIQGWLQELWPQNGGSPQLLPTGRLDWLNLLAICGAAMLFLPAMKPLAEGLEADSTQQPESGDRLSVRLALVYLVSSAAVLVYAVNEHLKFWNSNLNGGYNYRPFFQPSEYVQADLVLYSTSVLFASVAGLAAASAYLTFRVLTRKGLRSGTEFTPTDCMRLAVAGSLFWSATLMAPWQVKLLPEISAEKAWIMPASILGLTAAALAPLFCICLVLLKQDFDAQRQTLPPEASGLWGSLRVRRSEYAFLSLFLCPFYPWLRTLRPSSPRLHYVSLMLTAALVITALGVGIFKAEAAYDFDDWRGMMKSGVFPCSRVVLSLAAAYWVYLVGQRLVLGWTFSSTERLWRRVAGYLALSAGAVVLLLALWPLWGWSGVNRNVLARTFEYSDRHRFELGFLHWLLDFDGDGYASLLVDKNVRPYLSKPQPPEGLPVKGGMTAEPAITPVAEAPADRYEIRDSAKARALPNVVLLFLEGVTPGSISAYGKRNLERPATPHLDSIAAAGTRFNRARCCYPSTWDGWFAVLSGRLLRVQEMNESKLKGTDQYSRHNGVHHVLALAGFDRWCYPSVRPFTRLFCPKDDADKDFEPDFDSVPSSKEEDNGITRGDRCNERLLRFIDSLRPGERFFFSEHLTDTHFPWKRTTITRAKDLGFADGIEWCEDDALLNGSKWDKLARYYHTVTRMDAQVGALLTRLKERGLYDNTMIIVIGDHGCQWYEHEHGYYVSHLYEQSLHIPLLFKMPGLPAGGVSDAEVLQLDVLPTLAELAGIERIPPADPDLAPIGRSMAPLLKGEKNPEVLDGYRNRDVILTTHFNMMGIIEAFRHKLTVDRLSGTYLLFDLQTDPLEMNNLADREPERVQALLEKLREQARKNRSFFHGFNAVQP